MSRRAALAIVLAALGLVSTAAQGTPASALPGSSSGPVTATFQPFVLPAPIADAIVVPSGSPSPPPPLAAYADGGALPIPEARPRARLPQVEARVLVKPTPTPTPAPRIRTRHALSGNASWYCKAGVSVCMTAHPDGPGADMYAAAGPALRRAICGSDTSNCWRGRRVLVNGTAVVLADWCQCYKGQRHEKVIDLYWDAWARVPGVERGVTVRW